MRRCLVLLILTCILTCGCSRYGARETDEIAWVISIGLDKAADGDILATYRIAVPRSLAAGQEGGGNGKDSSELLTVKAPTLAEARNLINASLSRAVSLTHVIIFVVGEDLARAGVRDAIGPLLRFREFRGSAFLVVCRGQARDALIANKPPLETLVSRWVENYMHSYEESSYYLSLNLHEFYTRLKAGTGAPLAVGYGINPRTGGDRSTGVQPGDRVKGYLAGDLPKQGGNPTEFTGVAVFREDKLVGFLDTGETRALGILLDKFPRGFITVDDPLAPPHLVTVALRNGRKTKIDIDIGGDYPVINIDVFLEGEITGIPSGIAYESDGNTTLLEEQISNSIKGQIVGMLGRTQAWGADVADFGYYVRPRFLTLAEFRKYDWNSKFPKATFTVAVKTELRRTGLMRKSKEIRKDPDT